MFASLPFAFALIKQHRPEFYGMLPDGAEVSRGAEADRGDMIERGVGYATSMQETEFTFRQAIRSGPFWLMMSGFTVHNFVSGGFNVHIFPFLTDIGISEAAAGGMMGMMVFFTIPSRLFGGIIADRVPKNRLQLLLVVAFLLQVIGIGTFLLDRSLLSIYVLLACHGLSSGAVTPILILIIGRYFGRKSFGSILGTLLACLAPVGLVAPVYYGWIYDNHASYDIAFITALVLAAMATVIAFFVRAPRPPVSDAESLSF